MQFRYLNVLGGLPTLAFLIWIERNAGLPWAGAGLKLGWPWISLLAQPLWILILWNSALIFSLCAILYLSARSFPALALVSTGLMTFGVMALWQNTGKVIWSFPMSLSLTYAISAILYWVILAAALWFFFRKRDRKNAYLLGMLALLLTPVMSLDRLLLGLGFGIYFAFRPRFD